MIAQEGGTILLVEDTEDDVVLTLRAMKKSNISNRVVVARDGSQALDYLQGKGAYADAKKNRPALILLDLKLPRVDGLQVLKQVREDPSTRFVPVVILTSSKEHEDMLNGYKLGANSYIRKPLDFELFTQAIQQLGLYWLNLNETPTTG